MATHLNPCLTITSLRIRAVDVPIPPLKTAGGTITSCPLVLIDVGSADTVVGTSYLFAYTRLCLDPLATLLRNLGPLIVGRSAEPVEIMARLREGFRLVGEGGLVAMALGGLDMALWDLRAKASGLPLATLLGGTRKNVPAYWSVGMCNPADARRAAEIALAQGCRAMKIKIGHVDFADDLAAIHAVREVAGDELQLMVDYNQSLSVSEAIRRVRQLDEEALQWVEEPTLAGDFAGHASIARSATTPIQLGENWSSLLEMQQSVAAGASDLAMLDIMKIGGVTGWLRAAAVAQAHGLPVSSHIFPEISAHMLSVTGTVQWLEYLDLASPVLQEPTKIVDGKVMPSACPGAGVEWNEPAVEKYGVRAG